VILYLKDDIPVKKGEELKGTLLLKKSELNPRDLDVKLSYHYWGNNGKVDNQQYFLFA
jgi:hypothetical protein